MSLTVFGALHRTKTPVSLKSRETKDTSRAWKNLLKMIKQMPKMRAKMR